MHIQANIEGSHDSGRISLLSCVPIPGVNIVILGIATIGPSFEVLGELTADLAPMLDLNVSLAYTVQNVHFVFPLSYGPST
ncbi:hypothetical protein HETIRDRAFT_108700 [Heterobasidion irregulare TC 32-1]|uniref:Uncharacterized protein n=1 Tax=Heterobasidion irregulare (strain TC 32-1) TaxID=747525 RepID=W4K9D9_HETIT|nr:uncharacterized protein HETIRDRAFT_108700 [Heterobasidion irregulare TC 32-1]XP_009553010.1 uncharacterized protein HETIRDRAFT_456162 [Heterobasidion irregulare TC 32-1]ETW75614.1 hypothetical protein HETIRDRAFT_456162 [Heterobasidion irregulare TC 32-1]ETW82398.1 hypothetical protein HETIRDRAFT_108700 [Heterobasidion irregulare TC 32-1]